MGETLLDRVYGALLESERPWKAAEISEVYLKISAPEYMAGKLIRQVLSGDSRFDEISDGTWLAVPSASTCLAHARYLPVWLDTRGGKTPDTWVLWLKPREEASSPMVPISAHDSDSWEVARCTYQGLRPATIQAGSFGRFQQWMCRRHAASEWDTAHLDLSEWTRIALVLEGVPPGDTMAAARLPEIRKRWNLGPSSDDDPALVLRNVEELLDMLLERHGTWTESEMHHKWESRLAGRPVDTGGFGFSLDAIANLPERCGIYRFYGDGGTLLYVGKAANLARRVRSYFRPYPPEHSRREELMRQVRLFEYDLLPSELEALVRETQVIRTENPVWNVQIDVHAEEKLPPEWWWPLAFAARGDDPVIASLFVLTGPESGYMFRMPFKYDGGSSEIWSAWLGSLLAGDAPVTQTNQHPVTVPDGVERLDAPESRLALRYYMRRKDLLDRVEPCEVCDGSGFLRSLRQLTSETQDDMGPIVPRTS